jgi:hypothetical protein
VKKLLILSLTISLLAPVSAQGVEFGQDATGADVVRVVVK